MKIAVIGASGKQGRCLVKEAIARGHEVTAVARHSEGLPKGVKVIEKDLFDLIYDDLKENEVIIDAFGAWKPELLELHKTSLKYLCDLLSGENNRLLVVGGAGSLYVDPSHTSVLMDAPGFPDSVKPLATAMGEALESLRKRSDVRWTYVSPAADFVPDGERTGEYILGGEELILNKKGESRISYADYAVAMIDEAEDGKHIGERITVVSD